MSIINSDLDGCSALMMAAQAGHDSTVRRLIAAGAIVTHRSVDGSSSLMRACDEGHVG